MNLQDIRYVLKNDLKELLESHRNRPGAEPVSPKPEMHPNINICLPSASALIVKKPEPQEEMAHVARSFTMTRCAVSSPEIKPAVAQVSEPVLRMAQSSPILEGHLEDFEEARNANVSLCSVEINEIYTCYPELCEGMERDKAAARTGEDPEAEVELQDAPGDTAKVATTGVAGIQEREAGLSSDTETECSQEELNGVSVMNEVLRSARSKGGDTQSQFEYKFGKCVLDLKICQTLLQQATDSLSRTEAKLGPLEALGKPRRLFWGTQARELPAFVIPARGCQEKLETILRNIRAPLNGDRALQWKAVAPPVETYVSPPFWIPGTCRPLVIHSYQAAENRPKSGSQSQDATYWSDFGLEAAKGPLNQRGTEPNYQLLHPGVSFRRRKSPHLRRGSSVLEGIKLADGSLEKTAPEVYGANLRREERRMAQCEWTTEVKQMAKKVASGQLGFPAQHPASRWMLEREAEDIKAVFPSPANRERVRFCQPNGEVGKGQPSRAIGDHKVLSDHESERNLDSPLGRAAGPENQGKCSPIPASEGGAASHNHACRSLTTEDSCREHLEEPTRSPTSSLNVSEEFLTPDPDYFFGGSAPHEHSELEYSTAEEEEEDILEITEEICGQKEQLKQPQVICGQKDHPIDAVQRREFSHGTGRKYIHDDVPRRERFTPAISPGTAQDRRLGGGPRELEEEDSSLADIQDLSSISCKDSCKTSAFKTPRTTNSPIKASTPLSPVDPSPKFSSTVTKYKDYCVMTIDTSCWATHDVSLGTFPAACVKGVITEVAPAAQHPSAGLLEPDNNLWLPLSRGQAESGREFPSTQHPPLQKGAPDRLDAEDQRKPEEKTPSVSKAEDSLWFSESTCLEEDTERAHSSLDEVLEEVLCPIADSHDLNKGLPDAIQRREPSCAHHGNVEMKGAAEESFSESEGSMENVEGLS